MMVYDGNFQIMIFASIVELVYSVYVMRKINDDDMWHRVASHMMLMIALVVAIRNLVLTGNTLLIMLWVLYFVFRTHRDNKQMLDKCLANSMKGEKNEHI